MEKRKEFYLCCLLFCFKTLPLNIIARLPASGFAPGQRIDLALDIENQSSEKIRNFKVELFKVIKLQYLAVCLTVRLSQCLSRILYASVPLTIQSNSLMFSYFTMLSDNCI